jgi:HlyD family secretion protein
MKSLNKMNDSPAREFDVKASKNKGVVNAQPQVDQSGNPAARSANTLKRRMQIALLVTAALLVFVPLGVAAWSAHKPALVVRGEVQATGIKVVPKVVGRVQTLHVCKGDTVRKGQLLVSLENQELQTKLVQARRAMEWAKEHNRIVGAACVEDIFAQSNWWVKAKGVVEQAEQTVNRSRRLHAADVISLQELQDSERNLDWARSSERAAKANFDLALAVFGNEGRLAAAASLEQATQTLAELEALAAELAITSPVDGEVQGRIVGEGECLNPDMPVVSIVDSQQVWVRFNLPGDLISNLRMGTTLRVKVPALGNEEVPVKVNYISANGGGATNRAAKGTRGLELKTFEVRAAPAQVTEGLRVGMSALLTWRNVN